MRFNTSNKKVSIILLLALLMISCNLGISGTEVIVNSPTENSAGIPTNTIVVPTATMITSPTPEPTAQPTETPLPTPIPLGAYSGTLLSGFGDKDVILEFVNYSSETISIFWVDGEGQEHAYGELGPESASMQGTYSTHAWRLIDESGGIAAEFQATDEARQIYEISTTKQVLYSPFIPSEPEEEVIFQPDSACELPNVMNYDGVSLSFPRIADRIPSIGTVKVAVLFAEFSDVKTLMTPEEAFALVSLGTEEYFQAVSYGRMDVQLVPHLSWLMMSEPSTYYGAILEGHGQLKTWIQEAVDMADTDFDFSEIDDVVLIANPRASAIPYGPTWIRESDSRFNVLEVDGARIVNGITSGYDLTYWGFLWLPHEMGHSLGLVDLYGENYTGHFSLMNDIGGNAPEFLAYERWLLDWLDDEQIICQEGSDQTTTITPIETPGGIKAVMVPVGESRLVAVESRRALGFDEKLTTSGALVYTVDTSILTQQGPIVVENNRIPLKAGETLIIEGVTITVLEANDGGDTVQVTIK